MTLEIDVKKLAAEIINSLPSQAVPSHITYEEAAKALGCGTEHIRSLVAAGQLAAIDISVDQGKRGSLRIPLDEFRTFVNSRRVS